MKTDKIVFYCLLSLWQPLVIAVEIDNSITVTSQWIINTDKGDSQSLLLSIVPEINIDFENDWQLKSTARLRAEAIDGLQINDLDRDGYSDYSKPAQFNDGVELELREFYLQGAIT